MPLSFTSFHASLAPEGVVTYWNSSNEDGIISYEIQYSTDGIHFVTAESISANPLSYGNYRWTAAKPSPGNNYYRLKCVSRDGQVTLSQVINIFIPPGKPDISVAPNPVVGGVLQLRFVNEPSGVYFLRLFDATGQTVFSRRVTYNGGTHVESISANAPATGIYQLEITKPDESRQVIRVVY